MKKMIERNYEEKEIHRLCGRVKEICDVEMHESRIAGGLPYLTRKVLVETEGKYPDSAYFVMRGDYVNFPYDVDERVIVYYNLRGYTTDYGTHGTCLSAWQVTTANGERRTIADVERAIENGESCK